MLNKFHWLSAGLIIVLALLLLTCKDDNNNLGLDLQPPDDKLFVYSTDTNTIVAFSQIVDSVKTDETSLSPLGSMMDPVFGVSTASFYTQFRLSQTAFNFGTTPYPDSLVLTLDYAGFYGDSTSAMTIRVYELAEQIEIDSAYYSNMTLEAKTTLLAEKTFVPNFTDSVVVKEDTLAPHLRINLTDITYSLAVKLLETPADSLDNNASFLNYFYGLYVTAEPAYSGGAILYFNLMSTLSGMTLYYHNVSGDSLEFPYLINSNCARFGSFTHDYSLGDASFRAQVVEKDTALGTNICYVQALGGVKTFIRFPNLKNFYTDSKIAVNEARFFLKCAETEPILDPATLLIMVRRTEDGSYEILDDQLQGSDYFGGYYDDDDDGYWFRITSTVQDLMRADTTQTDYGFEIYLSGGAVNGERVLLGGSDPQVPELAEDKMKLVITYTKLN
ncbi:MAG: DUF4270 domain-containing protein [Bacteroidales bacterium]|jgi:hypothetical protein|nr:DUF4270 domain-containing protein [Bacteroidales bacterium]